MDVKYIWSSEEMRKMYEDFFNASSFEKGFKDFLKSQHIDNYSMEEQSVKEIRKLWNLRNRGKKINKIFEES